jgi:hypothetical protein
MQTENEISDGLRGRRVLLAAARAAAAAWLGTGALGFLLHGRAAFARLGRPDDARIAIACVELVGAALFLFTRTAPAAGLVLSLLLAWVAGFHFAVGWGSRSLYLYLAVVLALTAATRAVSPARSP